MSWILLLWACTPNSPAPDEVPLAVDCEAVVAQTDYTVGALSLVDVSQRRVLGRVAGLGGDPLVVAAPPYTLVMSRGGGDSLRVYADPRDPPLLELSLPAANPHGAIVLDERLVVTGYDTDALSVFELSSGSELAPVDLSPYADADGLPEAESLVRGDDALYLSLQRLDRNDGWAPAQGQVLALDPDTLAVDALWEVGPNPVLLPHRGPAPVTVISGVYWLPDGGIDWLNADGTLTPWLSGAELDRDVVGYAEQGAYTVVLTATRDKRDTRYEVRCYDADDNEQIGPVTSAFLTQAQAAPDGTVWIVARRSWAPGSEPGGLWVLDPASCSLRDTIPLAPDPYSLDFRCPG